MTIAPKITLSEEERATLHLWLRLRARGRLAVRAKIILMAAAGRSNREIATGLRTSPKTVSLWRRRFLEGRLAGIEKEAPRTQQSSKDREAMVRLIICKTTRERPAGGATRWTTRSLARELGISPSMVQRVWKAHGLNARQ